MGNELGALWSQELKASNGKPKLLRVLQRQFGGYFAVLGLVLFIVEIMFRAMQPYFLMKLISYYNSESDSVATGYIYAGGLILTFAMYTINFYPYAFAVAHMSMLSADLKALLTLI